MRYYCHVQVDNGVYVYCHCIVISSLAADPPSPNDIHHQAREGQLLDYVISSASASNSESESEHTIGEHTDRFTPTKRPPFSDSSESDSGSIDSDR